MLAGWLLFLVNRPGIAQTPARKPDPAPLLVLPPLDTILQLARAHSPSGGMQNALIARSEYFVKNQKQIWLDGIGIDLQLASSNQALLIQQANGDLNAYNNYNNGYRAAVNVRLSLYNFLGRKNLVRIAESEADAARQQRKFVLQEMEIAVVNKYYAIQAAQALLKIKSDAKQVNQQNRQMAEKEFAQGTITITELSRIVQISTSTEAEYEVAKQSLFENVKTLEILIGQKLFQ